MRDVLSTRTEFLHFLITEAAADLARGIRFVPVTIQPVGFPELRPMGWRFMVEFG